MRSRLLLAAGLFLCASGAWADGGRLRVHEDAGPFRVAIFTLPEPLVAGPADVSVLVQDRSTGEAVLDADVTLVMSGPGGVSVSIPAGRHARNRLFYGARVELAAGTWSVEARIRRGLETGDARTAIAVSQSSANSFLAWPYLAIPPFAVGLFAMNRRLRRRTVAAAAIVMLCLCGTTGCSYLKWRQNRSKGLSELKKEPSLVLEKEVLPENCFVLVGGPDYGDGKRVQVLAAAFAHSGHTHDLVGSREVIPARGLFGMLLPAGEYDFVYFADLNHDGWYSTNEVVGETPRDAPLHVARAASTDGVIVAAPSIRIDLSSPRAYITAVRIEVDPDPLVVDSVEDPVFDPAFGELGVYEPGQFMARTNVVYSVNPPDFKKTQVVLVHGIDGTPRDFVKLVPSLDPRRYHVWLFYYPSGLPLDKLGKILSVAVEKIAAAGPADLQLAIVAHSMGGLVARRAVNELCMKGKPVYLRAFASFDTPYGGVESAAGAVKRGTELVASWIDVAAGSPFLTKLHETDLPDDLPFELFFGWGIPGNHGPSPAGDGTITLASQLDPRAQAVATDMSGFGETHVGILSDAAALKELSRFLDESCLKRGAAQ
jgi:pimeloyl-ACP methyl ester carboxylesterase